MVESGGDASVTSSTRFAWILFGSIARSSTANSSNSIVPEPSASNESKRLSTWNLGTSKPSSGIAWWNSLRDTVPSPSVSQSLKSDITFACCFLSASRSTRIVASAAAPSWPARSECPLVPKTWEVSCVSPFRSAFLFDLANAKNTSL